jgi:hypothetical protein
MMHYQAPQHGTRKRYTKGCRCDACRMANAEYTRRQRERRQRECLRVETPLCGCGRRIKQRHGHLHERCWECRKPPPRPRTGLPSRVPCVRCGDLRPRNFYKLEGYEQVCHRCRSSPDHFWNRVDKAGPEGCWIWTGRVHKAARSPVGYGVVSTVDGSKMAHRVAFELAYGCELMAGQLMDHQCWNTLCVNPDHLLIATAQENGLNKSPFAGLGVFRCGYVWRVVTGRDGEFVDYETRDAAIAAAVEGRCRVYDVAAWHPSAVSLEVSLR